MATFCLQYNQLVRFWTQRFVFFRPSLNYFFITNAVLFFDVFEQLKNAFESCITNLGLRNEQYKNCEVSNHVLVVYSTCS